MVLQGSMARSLCDSKKKALTHTRQGLEFAVHSLDFGYFLCLKTLGPLDDCEFNLLAFFEGAVAIGLNGSVMHEDISTGAPFNKTVSLRIVEPLNFSSLSTHRSRDPFQSIKNLSYMFL
jgi:hypothetical protein